MDANSRRQSVGGAVTGRVPRPDYTRCLRHVTVRLHGTTVHVRMCIDGWEANHQFSTTRTSGQAWLAWGRMKGDVP